MWTTYVQNFQKIPRCAEQLQEANLTILVSGWGSSNLETGTETKEIILVSLGHFRIHCGVADPGCLSRIRIFSTPDPHQRIYVFLTQKIVS
jgi:hypothetical protein